MQPPDLLVGCDYVRTRDERHVSGRRCGYLHGVWGGGFCLLSSSVCWTILSPGPGFSKGGYVWVVVVGVVVVVECT